MRCCKNCKWYVLDERINDEKGKHVCYGHYLINTPFLYVGSLSEKNRCKFFKKKEQNLSHEEIRNEWLNKGIIFRKSTDI